MDIMQCKVGDSGTFEVGYLSYCHAIHLCMPSLELWTSLISLSTSSFYKSCVVKCEFGMK